MTDQAYMQLALSLAEATRGQTSPNPSVAAIVVKNGSILGTGVHVKAGGPHAEVHALRQAGEEARGATIYVTLEPCAHTGKTPPCVEAIINAGIQEVVVATTDPNPLVAGKGIAYLERHGISVTVGVEEERAKQLNASFFYSIQNQLPFVTLKAGMTLDGKIATSTGESKWITSQAAREDAHTLRHQNDAILVGKHTILHDNPSLTTRRPRGGHNPIRIVLDSELTIPITSKIVQDKEAPTWIYTTRRAPKERQAKLQEAGIEVIMCDDDTISVSAVLQDLAERQIQSVLVEGGAEVLASFLQAEAFQQLVLYIAPTIFGGSAKPIFGSANIASILDAYALTFDQIEQLGPDIKITATPRRKESVTCSQESLKNLEPSPVSVVLENQ
ncbi:bifunctional diaminohydroxyphosphoribosylaminopyrimidine deaminase/5-amino-6-(5-phosphoribosylamino)uracil reductase RibD [Chryseomicrobium palamuruense]|uniref:Riboflavin biosynthesis protein RibD n=1 Tax=Chryseomicrobium palamuruense TaxID=682973 RepID=A0ABV8V069_9BACL